MCESLGEKKKKKIPPQEDKRAQNDMSRTWRLQELNPWFYWKQDEIWNQYLYPTEEK